MSKSTKTLDLFVIDPRTDRTIRACYDATVITAVQEVRESGRLVTQMVIAGLQAVNVDEEYSSLRARWLDARGQEAVPAPEPTLPQVPLMVKPS